MSSLSFNNPGQSNITDSLSGASSGGVLKYPHPFFDVAQTYVPISVKHMFRWCHTYYTYGANGIVPSIINRLASYPVTGRRYKGETVDEEQFFEELLEEQLDIESFLIECLVDYYVYGNAFVSIHYPIVKHAICPVCGHSAPLRSLKYKFEEFKFIVQSCPNCKSGPAEFKIKDVKIPSTKGLNLIRWSPMDIDIFYNEVTGHSSYVLTVPKNIKSRIREGNPLFLNETPQVFIEAVAKSQNILLSPQNIFHMKRPNLAGQDMGWGQPLILPALKNLYLYQVLRKSQEAIAHEHIVPLRVIHPLPNGSADPVSSINLSSWQNTMRTELLRWRKDPNYIPMVPLPIGFQFLGGQGRSLMLVNEIRQISEQIAQDMGVPVEFAFGGGVYSGANISMRLVEGLFLRAQSQIKRLAQFLINNIARFKGVNPVTIEFVSVRTADDVQRKQILLSMSQANKISDKSLLSEFNIDYEEERAQIEREIISRSRLEQKQFLENAENQGKAQVIQARYQAEAERAQMKAQERLGVPQDQEAQDSEEGSALQEGSKDKNTVSDMTEEEFNSMVKKIKQLPKDQLPAVMEQLKSYLDPSLYQKLVAEVQKEDNEVDMRPLPEQKPPRREKQVV